MLEPAVSWSVAGDIGRRLVPDRHGRRAPPVGRGVVRPKERPRPPFPGGADRRGARAGRRAPPAPLTQEGLVSPPKSDRLAPRRYGRAARRPRSAPPPASCRVLP